MKEKIEKIKQDFFSTIKKVDNILDLEELEQKFFSRKSGEFTQIMKNLKNLLGQERKKIGQLINGIKKEINDELEKKKKELEEHKFLNLKEDEWIDVTQPKLPKKEKGHLHPNTIVQNELEDLFTSMGFTILDGPELESDYYNFEALNIPPNHPARDTQDTFFIKNHSNWVLRTQTSPVQIRAMEKYGAPLRVVAPGRCFRNEATDANHEYTFYQLEGLVIDKEISIANLIGVMKELLRGVFKKDIEIRLRPGHFPFVEPGFELDMKCLVCNGKGCGACAHSGWVETLPCGLVHPKVLEAGGLDPKKWTGFAFGLGLTRLVMQKSKIEDIRWLQSGDLRFLRQF